MKRCKHCGKEIVLVNLSIGPTWYHQSLYASMGDGAHRECHITVAEPEDEPTTKRIDILETIEYRGSCGELTVKGEPWEARMTCGCVVFAATNEHISRWTSEDSNSYKTKALIQERNYMMSHKKDQT